MIAIEAAKKIKNGKIDSIHKKAIYPPCSTPS
jgi:hypothetical protein